MQAYVGKSRQGNDFVLPNGLSDYATLFLFLTDRREPLQLVCAFYFEVPSTRFLHNCRNSNPLRHAMMT